MTLLMTAHLFCFIKIMKREIKFRVWNTKEKKFFTQEDDQRMDLSLHYWETTKHVEYPQQFTGLKDKNGIDIYEGDILSWESYEGTKNQTRWVVDYEPNRGFKSWSSSKNDEIVIGNIYQDPELCQ